MPEPIRNLPTYFAPAGRAAPQEIARQSQSFCENAWCNRLLDKVQNLIIVLNAQRQIVYANRRMLELLERWPLTDVIGKRPGEVMDCEHAFDEPDGCGTTRFCRYCGGANVALRAQCGERAVDECHITRRNGETLDFLVCAEPLNREEDTFTVFTLVDIQDQMHRRALEQVFFHDVLNTAGAIYNTAALMAQLPDEEASTLYPRIFNTTRYLIDEIYAQRDLMAAENGELRFNPVEVDARVFLEQVVERFSSFPLAKDRALAVACAEPALTCVTDAVLLGRILDNLMKNALEAVDAGATVTLSARQTGEKIVFSVHNPGVMDEEIQHQIFKKAFSTKGRGRGLGTYSVRLFTERYLGGVVTFSSSEVAGTVFYVTLPRIPDRAPAG